MGNMPEKRRRDITVILADKGFGYDEMYAPEDIASFDILKNALAELQHYRFLYLDDHASLVGDLLKDPPAFVLNLCDDGYKNEWESEPHIPSLLEMLGVPYSGAGPCCLYMCYKKQFVSSIARSAGVPVPKELYVEIDFNELENTFEREELFFPALIKPAAADGSDGITPRSLVTCYEEVVEYLREITATLPEYKALLYQEYLPGNEYHIGLIGNMETGLEVLPVLEVDYSGLPEGLPRILTSDSKWSPQSVYCQKLSYKRGRPGDELYGDMITYSATLFKTLECRDYARFDFRLDANGVPKIIDVNPNPSWAHDGKMNMMAKWAGYSYSDMLDRIIRSALVRNKL